MERKKFKKEVILDGEEDQGCIVQVFSWETLMRRLMEKGVIRRLNNERGTGFTVTEAGIEVHTSMVKQMPPLVIEEKDQEEFLQSRS